AAILIGCRTDLLFALGAGFTMRWWQKRERFDLVAAGLLVMTCTVATLALIRFFPDAHYPPGVGPVQLSYNFDALTVCVRGAFLATALGPLVALRGPSTAAVAVRDVASERSPLLALIVAEVASMFVFGRIDEVRLIF